MKAILAALAVTAVLVGPPSSAAAGGGDPLFPPRLGEIAPVPDAAPLRDRVITGNGRRRPAAATSGFYSDGDGHSVRVVVSEVYPPNPAREQAVASFLGTLQHGDEMDALTVEVLHPVEVDFACGADVDGCYNAELREMYISGNPPTPNDPPPEYIIAHEYAHHVARSNINPPFGSGFGAFRTGPKYWASSAAVCRGVETGYFDPTDYERDPTEVFAETFAQKRFPGLVPWSLKTDPPVPGEFDAIDLDVATPWTKPRTTRYKGRLGSASGRVFRRTIKTTLDGTIDLKLVGPRAADYNLFLQSANGKTTHGKSVRTGSRERLRFVICGERRVRAVVKRVEGAGPLKLTVKKP